MTNKNIDRRRLIEKLFKFFVALTAWGIVCLLIVLIFNVLKQGMNYFDWQFLTNLPSRKVERAGIFTALWGSFWLMVITITFALPIGVGSAVFLEEYSGKGWLSQFIDINVSNLAGVPSIVYGLLGLSIFVHLFQTGRSVLAGGLTLGLLILPVIIITTRGALNAVPKSIVNAAYALGAKKWQVLFHHTLPFALPGILTGVILSISRALGETAPLIIIGAAAYVAFVPESPLDEFTALPIQIFNWISRPQQEFHNLGAAGIIVLLTAMLAMNSTAIFFRYKYQRNRNV